jgi:peptide/nickel transport system permease protein
VPEARRFPLGSDRFGRDLWARLVYGARVSLAVALLAVLLAALLGTAVGAAAAMGGELVDSLLMRLVDALLAVPRIFLLLVLVAFFSPGTGALVAIIGLTTWTMVARLVRAEVLALQEREFVIAARALGAHPLRVLFVHLLPNALTSLVVMSGLMVGLVVLLESSLSFLELGIQPPTPSWGNMIAESHDRLIATWWVPTFPGIAIVLTVLGFNLLADGLRDALDPRR